MQSDQQQLLVLEQYHIQPDALLQYQPTVSQHNDQVLDLDFTYNFNKYHEKGVTSHLSPIIQRDFNIKKKNNKKIYSKSTLVCKGMNASKVKTHDQFNKKSSNLIPNLFDLCKLDINRQNRQSEFSKTQINKQEQLKQQLQLQSKTSKTPFISSTNRPSTKNTQRVFIIKSKTQCKEPEYNPIDDRNLIQYFYPRQKNLIRTKKCNTSKYKSTLNKDSKATLSNSPRNSVKMSRVKLFEDYSKVQCFEIQKQFKKQQQMSQFDQISYNKSLLATQKLKKVAKRPYKLNSKDNKQNRIDSRPKRKAKQLSKDEISHYSILKKRIQSFEMDVIKKVPYLYEMGIKFKLHCLN